MSTYIYMYMFMYIYLYKYGILYHYYMDIFSSVLWSTQVSSATSGKVDFMWIEENISRLI